MLFVVKCDEGERDLTIQVEDKTRGELIAELMELRARVAELEIQEAERRFQADAISSLAVGVVMARSSDSTIIYTNRCFDEMFGYAPGELSGKKTVILNAAVENKKPEDVHKEIVTSLRKYGMWSGEVKNVRKDGSIIWCLASASRLQSAQHGTVWVGVHEDITEHKRTEEAYRTLVENSLQGLLIIQDNRVVFTNSALVDMSGYTIEEMPSFSPRELKSIIHPDDRVRIWQRLQDRLSRKPLEPHNEFRFIRKDGSIRWIKSLSNRIEYQGAPAVQITYIDITESKRAEAEREKLLNTLRRHGTQLRAAAAVSMAATTILEPDELTTHVVKLLREGFGFYHVSIFLISPGSEYAELHAEEGMAECTIDTARRKQIVGDTSLVGTCISTAQAQVVSAAKDKDEWGDDVLVPETRNALVLPLLSIGRCIGAVVIQSIWEIPFSTEDVETMQNMANHITIALENARLYQQLQQELRERRHVEKSLRENEERLRILMESSEDIIMMQDLEGVFLYYNGPPEYNITAEAVLGKTSFDFWDHEIATAMQKELEQAIAEGKTIIGERNINWRGESLWFIDHRYPVRDTNGRIVAVGTISRNITERRRMEEQLRNSLAEKTVLLQEIHHRVKNNLQVVSSMLDMQSAYLADEQARAILLESQRRVDSMAMIHERLYQSDNLARIDFGDYINNLAVDLCSAYSTSATGVSLAIDVFDVILDIEKAIPCGLIVNELLSNALKHAFPTDASDFEDEKRIRVEMRAVDGECSLTIADNGVGFPPNLDFRHTETLGLQIVTLLVKQLHGNIALEGRGGTAFHIAFPDSPAQVRNKIF